MLNMLLSPFTITRTFGYSCDVQSVYTSSGALIASYMLFTVYFRDAMSAEVVFQSTNGGQGEGEGRKGKEMDKF